MANYSTPSALTVEQWESQYFKDYINSNWFKKFMGSGSNSMIQVKTDLTSKPGNKVTMTLVNRLQGEATNEGETLEGNEEEVKTRSFSIEVHEYSHAVRFEKFEAQKSAIDVRKAHKDVLMDWNMELDRDKIIAALHSINGVAYSAATKRTRMHGLLTTPIVFSSARRSPTTLPTIIRRRLPRSTTRPPRASCLLVLSS